MFGRHGAMKPAGRVRDSIVARYIGQGAGAGKGPKVRVPADTPLGSQPGITVKLRDLFWLLAFERPRGRAAEQRSCRER